MLKFTYFMLAMLICGCVHSGIYDYALPLQIRGNVYRSDTSLPLPVRIKLYDDNDVAGSEIGVATDGQIRLDYVYQWARRYSTSGLAKVYSGNTPTHKFSIELSSEGFRTKTFVFRTKDLNRVGGKAFINIGDIKMDLLNNGKV